MPMFDFVCTECGHVEEEFLHGSKLIDTCDCVKCGALANRKKFYASVHAKIGAEFDSKPRGKVIQEKNERLKRMHSGYEHEHESLRAKVQKDIADKTGHDGTIG